MPLPGTAKIAVVLPGTGSDADFARRAFTRACTAIGVETVAVEPDAAGIVAGYRAALDRAATAGPILAGGISIGAAVAVDWARRHPGAACGVLAALPAWTGKANGAPAALSAALTATKLREEGLDATIAHMRASSPEWLADALEQSWRSQWPDLPDALDEAANYVSPTVEELAALDVPVGLVGAVDDPIHPLTVAQRWVQLLPNAALHTVRLADIGADPAVVGFEAVRALAAC
ncbi:alpha/beta hydrolase [Skermania sp. ID1734]|uniref:alpha/beta fold hydrolase n=1 Tax=Skermania sp. ID1734 TaxID=2597516 RepID=UPI00117CFDD1|nr:alpha/beta hydrolase [Skermania sp. ID1734]TSD96026.1 alpha/beta hydrolase [Skermania sp. ID1734]